MKNRFGIDLVKYLSYVLDWDKENILDDIDYLEELAVGTVEGYTLAIYLMLKSMYKDGRLFVDYIKPESKSLSYIIGTLDINKSIQENTFSREEVYQSYNALSINTHVNMSIKFCLDLLIAEEGIRDSEFAKRVSNFTSNIFKTNCIEPITEDSIRKHLDVIYTCLDLDSYRDYYPVLKLCQLYLEQLYIKDSKLDSLSGSEFFNIDMPFILQEFLRASIKKVMIRLTKDDVYSSYFKNKYAIRKRECHLSTSGLTMDILVRFTKKSDFPHLIFDSKTNEDVKKSQNRNRQQIQTYVTEYSANLKSKRDVTSMGEFNTIGILQYFVDYSASKSDLKMDGKLLPSDIKDIAMYNWVFQLLPNTEPEEFEEYLYQKIVLLLEL